MRGVRCREECPPGHVFRGSHPHAAALPVLLSASRGTFWSLLLQLSNPWKEAVANHVILLHLFLRQGNCSGVPLKKKKIIITNK